MSLLVFRKNQGSRFALPLFPVLAVNLITDVIAKKMIKKSQRRLTQQENILVILNQSAYKLPEQRLDIGQFKYIGNLSNQELAVFKLESHNQIYIIYKGTSNKENLLTDLKLIKNIQDRTFKRALEQYDLIHKMYPGFQKILSGHSLGSSKALYVSNKRNVKGTGFNTFTPSTSGIMFNISKNTPQFTHIINRDDILSNNQIIINPPNMVVMVLKPRERGLLASHNINTYPFPDKYIF